jgi:hypothetical protein
MQRSEGKGDIARLPIYRIQRYRASCITYQIRHISRDRDKKLCLAGNAPHTIPSSLINDRKEYLCYARKALHLQMIVPLGMEVNK